MSKYDLYEDYKNKLKESNYSVSSYSEINYGIQFTVSKQGKSGILRIYESKKKGTNPDFSQLNTLKEEILSILNHVGVGKKEKTKSETERLKLLSEVTKPLIGTDESGKGDYFGPLVVAGVYADEKQQEILKTLGIQDSKNIKSDKKIFELEKLIKKTVNHQVVVIKNKKYNELYANFNNLNKLMGWGHSRIIRDLSTKTGCKNVLVDKFGNECSVQNLLNKEHSHLNVDYQTKAEANIVVASASILARAEFIRQMDFLSKKYDIIFPKGASNLVIEAGKKYVTKYGKEKLIEVAKLHFGTTDKI